MYLSSNPSLKCRNHVATSQASHYGWLWSYLRFMGIDMLPNRTHYKSKLGRFSALFLKLRFPVILFCVFVFILYSTWSETQKLDYNCVLDALLSALPVAMWMTVIRKRRALRRFLAQFVETCNNGDMTELKFKMSRKVNAFLLFNTLSPFGMVFLNYYKSKETNLITEKTPLFQALLFRICITTHNILLPSVLTTFYSSTCYWFIQQLRFFKRKFADPGVASVRDFRTYYSILICIDKFQDVSSEFVFFDLCHNFCLLSFIVVDALLFKVRTIEIILESIAFLLHGCVTISMITLSAAQITVEITKIRYVLLDCSSGFFSKKWNHGIADSINAIVRRDIPVLSALNVFMFDRSFILKAIGGLVAQVFLVYQIIYT